LLSVGELILLTSVVLHLAAGIVAGSVFTIPTLLVLVVALLVEAIGLAFIYGPAAGFAPFLGIMAVQVGYIVGIYARSQVERLGASRLGVRVRRTP
jgi:hypothetical protein